MFLRNIYKKTLIILFLLGFIIVNRVNGQTSNIGFLNKSNNRIYYQLAASPEEHINISNCDRCGYCKESGEYPAPKTPSYWQSCRTCLYPGVSSENPADNLTLIGIPTVHPDHYYIVGMGCLSTVPAEFATQITGFLFSIIGFIAFLFLLYGALSIATARSNPEKLSHGKRILYGAIIGLVFSASAILIIRIMVRLFGIPGIE